MRIIRRYANRKHYDLEQSHYVTLGDIAALVRTEEYFKVIDHFLGADLTSQTLAQIIFEEEKRGNTRLPAEGLAKIIREGLPA